MGEPCVMRVRHKTKIFPMWMRWNFLPINDDWEAYSSSLCNRKAFLVTLTCLLEKSNKGRASVHCTRWDTTCRVRILFSVQKHWIEAASTKQNQLLRSCLVMQLPHLCQVGSNDLSWNKRLSGSMIYLETETMPPDCGVFWLGLKRLSHSGAYASMPTPKETSRQTLQ